MILVLSDVFPPKHGGSGRWLFDLYRRLPQFDVTVIAGSTTGDAEFDRASPLPTRRLTSPFSSWGLMNPRGARGYWRAVRQVRTAIVELGPQAIHCGKCLPEGLVALLARRSSDVPVWCFAHGEELTLARTSRELRRLTTAVLSRASGIVANSEHTRRLLVDDWAVDPAKIAVLTPGVDTTHFVPAEPDAAARARFGWTGRRVMLTVGALQKRKGQDMLIRALPEIRRQCPDVLYAIAGEGWEHEYLSGLVRDLGIEELVCFLGALKDVELLQAYQQCDLFALPNRQVGWDLEGFGIVLLEAQACGKAVVTGRSGGTVETIVPGVTGEIVSCDEPQPLAQVCAALLCDPIRRASMGVSARARVVERFDWQVLARQAAEIFFPIHLPAAGMPPGSR